MRYNDGDYNGARVLAFPTSGRIIFIIQKYCLPSPPPARTAPPLLHACLSWLGGHCGVNWLWIFLPMAHCPRSHRCHARIGKCSSAFISILQALNFYCIVFFRRVGKKRHYVSHFFTGCISKDRRWGRMACNRGRPSGPLSFSQSAFPKQTDLENISWESSFPARP